VADAEGKPVREMPAPAAAGLHRVAWNLRVAGGGPAGLGGAVVRPGRYTVTLEKVIDKTTATLGEPQTFEVAAPAPASAAQP
jgi:hypothetical protein